MKERHSSNPSFAELATFKTKELVKAIQYHPSVYVPGLLYEVEKVTTKSGDEIGPHAIVLSESGYIVVFPGQYLFYERSYDRVSRVVDSNVVDNCYDRL